MIISGLSGQKHDFDFSAALAGYDTTIRRIDT